MDSKSPHNAKETDTNPKEGLSVSDPGFQLKSSDEEQIIQRLYELTENQRIKWETLGETEFRFTRGNWLVIVGHKIIDGDQRYYYRIRNTVEDYLMEGINGALKKLVHSLEGVSPVGLFLEEVI